MEYSVDGGDRRSLRLPAKNREFVRQDDDFEILQLPRPSPHATNSRSQRSNT
jgi:hypothetical protein